MSDVVYAAVLVIGDEILSGRTQDINLKTIAEYVAPLGISIREARVISDDPDTIMNTVRKLAAENKYVFTTGGIGPTHDDITAENVARAFDRYIDVRDDARQILADWYAAKDIELNEARLRMARIPEGAELIPNPVSAAPGFKLENVFVMAGVPRIMRAMLHNIGDQLVGGSPLLSVSVRAAGLKEGDVAVALAEIAESAPDISLGSYPWFDEKEGSGVALVARGRDQAALDAVKQTLEALVASRSV